MAFNVKKYVDFPNVLQAHVNRLVTLMCRLSRQIYFVLLLFATLLLTYMGVDIFFNHDIMTREMIIVNAYTITTTTSNA